MYRYTVFNKELKMHLMQYIREITPKTILQVVCIFFYERAQLFAAKQQICYF